MTVMPRRQNASKLSSNGYYIYIWLVVLTILKNMKVSWDDDIPNIWKNKIHVPNHQPAIIKVPRDYKGTVYRLFGQLIVGQLLKYLVIYGLC